MGGALFELDDFQQKALTANGCEPGEITVGLRPQQMLLGEGGLRATVEISEMMGSEVTVHAFYGEKEICVVVPVSELKTDIVPGSTLSFGAAPGALQLFDPATGRNLIWYDAGSAEKHEPVCKKYDF